MIGGAAAFIAPAHEEGDPATLIEAFSLGTPVIHSDVPEYTETAAGAALSVPVGVAGEGYVNRLAAAISTVATDDALAERLSITARTEPGASAGATRPSGSGSCTPTSEPDGRDAKRGQSWKTAAAARAS